MNLKDVFVWNKESSFETKTGVEQLTKTVLDKTKILVESWNKDKGRILKERGLWKLEMKKVVKQSMKTVVELKTNTPVEAWDKDNGRSLKERQL